MEETNKEVKSSITVFLIASIVILVGIGFGFLYSASKPAGIKFYNNEYYYIIRQSIYFFCGMIIFIAALFISPDLYRKYIKFIVIGTIVLLIITLLPFVGKEVSGAKRWISFSFIQFQPSEFAKISIILYLSSVLANKKELIKDFYKGVLPPLIMSFLIIFLIFIEPDFSTSFILILLVFIMLFLSGVNLVTFFMLLGTGFLGLFVMLIFAQYRLKRFLAFLNPWVDPLGAGWQYIQAMKCFALGKAFGVGIGESTQKNFGLPEAQNDYIFAIIAEEGGAFFAIIVVILFMIITITGFNIAKSCKNRYYYLLASGITLIIFLQSIINISVVIGLLPSTGITLPFISSGGSSLIVFMFLTGVLLNISFNKRKLEYED
ncbi:MAG TPA: putative lipid II flippase FtsW [Spirochaetota bacterium]|nr:putative lipid II flippase FtsW [Spirochaetota bacterium]HOL56651.1 putative lipid II flippase FtsW [Spirochaetota bacterium]HPP04200.1 putative lipid II flippase FtsW [Spirochaetota bacterium]